MSDFSPKDPAETVLLTFDFTNALATGETISTAEASIEIQYGVDPGVGSMLTGPTLISGSKVGQLVTAGLVGHTYLVCCTITTSASQTLILSGNLAIEQIC